MLLRRHEAGEAQLWLAKLEKLEPGKFRTAELKARMLKMQDQGEQAATILKSYAQAHDADILPVAALLEDLGQVAAAEELYKKYVSQNRSK